MHNQTSDDALPPSPATGPSAPTGVIRESSLEGFIDTDNGEASLQTGKANQVSGRHNRLASFSTGESSPFSIGSSSGSISHGVSRSFVHGSYHHGNPNAIPRSSSVVRDYTAEIASMALNDSEESPTTENLAPLPSPVEVPLASSKASSSTLTNLLRQGASVSSTYLEPAVGFTSPDDEALGNASNLQYDESPNDDLEDYSAEDPLLASHDSYGSDKQTRLNKQRYGSEFGFEDPESLEEGANRQFGNNAASWLRRPSLLSRKGSVNFNGSVSSPIQNRRSGRHNDYYSDVESEFDYPSANQGRVYQRIRPLMAMTRSLTKDWRHTLMLPVHYIPSVILGVLLNVLDGLSYGMILFPLGEPLFNSLGADGLSMFYVSCIISQLVYSFGGSSFKGGVGSEMIEVVPFFHSIAYRLLYRIGTDKPDSVLATTVLAYALSSILTGVVFFLLGWAKIGSMMGFFPRHILVGCIGGVGWFLIVTGIEVSSRMEGNLTYTSETLSILLQPSVLLKWVIPLLLAVILLVVEHFFKHTLIVPAYFMAILFGFHILVALIPGLSLQQLRNLGWLFESPEVKAPWYNFYYLYKFSAVDWSALTSTIPAMFALTFFGILHVPINVPALAVSLGNDDIDLNRELISHGISNALSGMCGSIQNYLVYTNSLLFIRSGADSRLAGFMLAMATMCVMFAGPGVIGFIPVMVVGALIFLLGIELMREALYDTWGRVNRFEYFVIAVIIVTMGVWDFVYGILVGIILACVSFVVESSRKSAIKATYSGAVVHSTVRRHPFQQRFLKEVGDEIFVCRLTGFLFFGTIVSVETKIRSILTSSNETSYCRIKYLVMDFQSVRGLDFSAAEAFTRMKRLLTAKQIILVVCSVSHDVEQALRAVSLWENENNGMRAVVDLNSALEFCENELLAVYYRMRSQRRASILLQQRQNAAIQAMPIKADMGKSNSIRLNNISSTACGTPRETLLHDATSSVMISDPTIAIMSSIDENSTAPSSSLQQKQPLTLWMQIMHELSPYSASFWEPLCDSFRREQHLKGTKLYDQNAEADGFYVVESGILKAEYHLESGYLSEAIVAGTTAGELPFFSDTQRTASLIVERDAVVWRLTRAAWHSFLALDHLDASEREQRQKVAVELHHVVLKLTAERFSSVTQYILTSAN
ncbi:sulfate transporter family-domain-containing protein [Dipodascopsis uninucleata]